MEVTVGLGPAESFAILPILRAMAGGAFPGVGEFQCYDKYMLEDLKLAADAEGKPEW